MEAVASAVVSFLAGDEALNTPFRNVNYPILRFWNNDVSFKYLALRFLNPHIKIFKHTMLACQSGSGGC